MSDSSVARLPKPQMRGMLHAQIKRSLLLVFLNCATGGSLTYYYFYYLRKTAYAEFYKNYDIEKEFNKMRKLGLFGSCDIGEDDDD